MTSTDIAAGVERGMKTILVLSGITRREEAGHYPYCPTSVLGSVAEE